MDNYSDYGNCFAMNNQVNQYNKMFKPTTPIPGVFSNPNFNKCNYNQQDIHPGDLFDSYQGFIRGNMFPDLYNTYKTTKPYVIEPMNEQAELLTYVDALCFAAHDLNLYLDTHPNDKDIIRLFNQYREDANKAIKKYEEQFGPLFDFSDALNVFPWAWNQLPWPWENR